MSNNNTPLLEVKQLEVQFATSTGVVNAVRKANLTIYPGQSVAIVGESGSGKSTLAASIIGLLPSNGRVSSGEIIFNTKDIAHFSSKEMQQLRGSEIGLVPQDPMSNLNPVWRIGYQVGEALYANKVVPKSQVNQEVDNLLTQAGLPNADRCSRQYPHELSGGMRQRVLIATGLAAKPKLLIADEPTSALDVTVQRKILDHLGQLTKEIGTAVLFITHDLGLAAERAEHLVVMHRGRIVESGPALEILQNPQHPYTQRLISAAPSLASTRLQSSHQSITDADQENPEIIRVENLYKTFDVRGKKKKFTAVDNVSFSLQRGTTLAIVGESGSGKSTVANIILNLIDPTSGKVYYEGVDLSGLDKNQLFALRRKLQVVFQNPYGSLDPMYSIYHCIEEPLKIHRIGTKQEREQRVIELLELVSLPKSVMHRYPNELSGGQRQRIAIARALALNPEIIVLDEAVSALDVLVQNQILQLLNDLQAQLGLSFIFITHDLAVVRQIADKVIVMEHGKLVEEGTVDDIFHRPQQQYTKDLIDAVPGSHIQLHSSTPDED